MSSKHMTPEQVLGTGELLATTTRFLNTHVPIQTGTYIHPVSTGDKWKRLLDTGPGYTEELPLKSRETTVTES